MVFYLSSLSIFSHTKFFLCMAQCLQLLGGQVELPLGQKNFSTSYIFIFEETTQCSSIAICDYINVRGVLRHVLDEIESQNIKTSKLAKHLAICSKSQTVSVSLLNRLASWHYRQMNYLNSYLIAKLCEHAGYNILKVYSNSYSYICTYSNQLPQFIAMFGNFKRKKLCG